MPVNLCTLYTAVLLKTGTVAICATKQGIGLGSSLSGVYCLQGSYRGLNS